MYEIAHGIDIHYDNNKNNLNIVLIQGKEPIQYTFPEILLPIVSDGFMVPWLMKNYPSVQNYSEALSVMRSIQFAQNWAVMKLCLTFCIHATTSI